MKREIHDESPLSNNAIRPAMNLHSVIHRVEAPVKMHKPHVVSSDGTDLFSTGEIYKQDNLSNESCKNENDGLGMNSLRSVPSKPTTLKSKPATITSKLVSP